MPVVMVDYLPLMIFVPLFLPKLLFSAHATIEQFRMYGSSGRT